MQIDIKRLRNALDNEQAVESANDEFLMRILNDSNLELCENNQQDFSMVLIETGGSEEQFVKLLPSLKHTIYLLTNGDNNSLAASLEILTYLKANNYHGEIIHGTFEYIKQCLTRIVKNRPLKNDCCERLGVVGKPSNWLIASQVNVKNLRTKHNIELIDITMDEFKGEIEKCFYEKNLFTKLIQKKKFHSQKTEEALCIYGALQRLVKKYHLRGLTVRCFDLLNLYHNTSCVALAILNAQGITATCEGDTTTLITMHLINKYLKLPSFQANPSRIEIDKRLITLAHCTLPLNMVDDFSLNTHFESNLGVAVKGEMKLDNITMIKINSELNEIFVVEGKIMQNLSCANLCRTQIMVEFNEDISSLLIKPFGNHQVIVYGHHAKALKNVL